MKSITPSEILGKEVMYEDRKAEGGYATAIIVEVAEGGRRIPLVKLDNGRWLESRKLFFVEKRHRLGASASATA